MGYDVTKECIPVVPAQHYFMGGIKVDYESRTTMTSLYAVGETACNRVHGRNRLASNSLLESMVFAGRAADDIAEKSESQAEAKPQAIGAVDLSIYKNYEKIKEEYKSLVLGAIEKANAINPF